MRNGASQAELCLRRRAAGENTHSAAADSFCNANVLPFPPRIRRPKAKMDCNRESRFVVLETNIFLC